jgi:hypothetical protein
MFVKAEHTGIACFNVSVSVLAATRAEMLTLKHTNLVHFALTNISALVASLRQIQWPKRVFPPKIKPGPNVIKLFCPQFTNFCNEH